MEQTSSIADVLSGNKALQFNISLDYKTTALLAAALFIAVTGALLIYKKLL
jgi:hypothetical protein